MDDAFLYNNVLCGKIVHFLLNIRQQFEARVHLLFVFCAVRNFAPITQQRVERDLPAEIWLPGDFSNKRYVWQGLEYIQKVSRTFVIGVPLYDNGKRSFLFRAF